MKTYESSVNCVIDDIHRVSRNDYNITGERVFGVTIIQLKYSMQLEQ